MRGLADISEQAGDGSLRFSMNQNVMLAYVPAGALKRVYGRIVELDLADDGADEISDVITCPGAYSCNLGLTKTMGLGYELRERLKAETDPQVRQLRINASGCPNACGQHWVGDIGFYGNARKIDGPEEEVPYYLMLLGGTYQQFGVAMQSLPARLAPVAVGACSSTSRRTAQEGESFRAYVMRYKVETFRQLTADLAKPPPDVPEMYPDWGDEVDVISLQLGRGECAA